MFVFEVNRDVPAGEFGNTSDRDIAKGEVLYKFNRATYGCVDIPDVTPVSVEPGEYPFFLMPDTTLETIANV